MGAKDWKIDFQKTFGTTHKKLEKLAADKTKEVEIMVKADTKENNLNKNKKKVVNIDLKASPESAYGNLKYLIQQLDKMVNCVQGDSPTLHSIPIYSKEARGQVLPAYSNTWLEFQRSMRFDIDAHLTSRSNKQSFLDVLEDFKVKYNHDKILPKKISKSRVDQSNVVNAQKRMLERKFNKNTKGSTQHVFKQYKKNGKEHFLIVKKDIPEPQIEVEDIFQDWKDNLVDVFEQRRLAAVAARKNRTRKLSNRAARKELLKEINEAEDNKPKSYADMLKKNLKVPMEDIFEAWRDYLHELDEILNNDSRTSFCKVDESPEDILETCQGCYQKEMAYCGQPTIKSATKQKEPKYAKEIFFASWRHNLDSNTDSFKEKEKIKYQAENYFAEWKFNLMEDGMTMEQEEIEAIFEDWVHNLNHKLSRSDSKMLKYKQRQQRRSKNKRHQF